LKADYVSGSGVLAQSIANIAPSATPAYVLPLVFATAGNGTWLTYLFATVATVLVGSNLNRFARRSASPGSLYVYIAEGLGSDVAVNSGWALLLAYVLTAGAVLCGFVNYTNILLRAVGYGD
jgi:amino acid transporter